LNEALRLKKLRSKELKKISEKKDQRILRLEDENERLDGELNGIRFEFEIKNRQLRAESN